MKKIITTIVSVALFYSLVFAQDMTFTFISKDASNLIDSIKAVNIATGESALTIGTNEISFTSTNLNIYNKADGIMIYAKSTSGQSEMQFYCNQQDNIKISLINANGQVIATSEQKLDQGLHKFYVTTSYEGLYILQLIGEKHYGSQKIISRNNHGLNNNIRYIGTDLKEIPKKSLVSNENDLIHFFIYSGDKLTMIADSPIESKTYEVDFFVCIDGDGKNYPIVQIGNQWWMAENLAYLPSVMSTFI